MIRNIIDVEAYDVKFQNVETYDVDAKTKIWDDDDERACWSKCDWQMKRLNVRADSQPEVSEMLDWLMQIQRHESRQRRQLMLMIQI